MLQNPVNKAKHILFHRPTPWDSEINCSTKIYAKLFSESGYKVSYLQGTINPGHRILKRGYYSTWKQGARFENDIWVTGGFGLVPYLEIFKLTARITRRLSYLTCIPSIKSLVRESGYGDPDIIWTTIPGSTILGEVFPNATLFFHVVDKYSAYRGDVVTTLEKYDYQRADHIFVIGHALGSHLQQEFAISPEKITNLGQGVALEKYEGEPSIPRELRELPRPVAIWVGLIKKLDFELLWAVVEKMRSIGGSTVLIGPGSEEIRQHISDSSLVCLGSKVSDEIPDYLRASDIGLMLYDRRKQEIYEGQHPLKLYEYAAAGLPAISTYHKEFDFVNPPVLEVELADDISVAIDEILSSPLRYRTEMLDFASSHSWDSIKVKVESVFEEFGV